jgi:hypothetical protein
MDLFRCCNDFMLLNPTKMACYQKLASYVKLRESLRATQQPVGDIDVHILYLPLFEGATHRPFRG